MSDTTTNALPTGGEVDLSCDTFIVKNHTQIDFTNGEYGGIPFNLILNSVGWVVSAVVPVVYYLAFQSSWLHKLFACCLCYFSTFVTSSAKH